MFEVGDSVLYGTNGICEIKEITTVDMTDIDKNRLFYVLHSKNSTAKIYVPVDRATAKMRKLLSKKEAEELLSRIPDIEPLTGLDEKTLESAYKDALRTYNTEEWIKLIKTIYFRKKKRIDKGQKVTAIDEKYMKLAEDILYQELGEALEIPKEQVLDYLIREIEGK